MTTTIQKKPAAAVRAASKPQPNAPSPKPALHAPAANRGWVPRGGAARVATAARWDYPKGLSAGVFLSPGTNPHPLELLAQAPKQFPGSKTFLYYKSITSNPADLPDAYFARARAEGITPQLGFESGNLDLKDLRGALEGRGQLPETNARNRALNATYRNLEAWADHLKTQGPIIFRPLSEMNDASGAWELGRPGNTPQDYARVWNEMHALFDARGARNLRWTFDVLAVKGQPQLGKVQKVLSQIPARNIDNVGMNPYALPVNGKLESFQSLVEPWLRVFEQTGHGRSRPVISEMGVSNNPKGHDVAGNSDPDALKPGTAAYQKLDAARAQWIHDAFAYARKHDFASVTYFTQMNTHWRVDPGSMAYRALQHEIAK